MPPPTDVGKALIVNKVIEQNGTGLSADRSLSELLWVGPAAMGLRRHQSSYCEVPFAALVAGACPQPPLNGLRSLPNLPLACCALESMPIYLQRHLT